MLSLKNKTVLITRSANQANNFIHQLQNLGAKTITLPLIENTAINKSELAEKINKNNYDWIIFTSVNAVQFFFETISPEHITSKIAVVGTKTAKLLEEYKLKAAFTPSDFTARNLADEIHIEANQQILIPRSNLAKNDIIEILESRNCSVDTISIYKNAAINYSPTELEKTFSQKIDFITFTSGSTVTSFTRLGIELNDEKIICIGPETAKIAKQNNIKVTAVANPHTIEGMVEAIIDSSSS